MKINPFYFTILVFALTACKQSPEKSIVSTDEPIPVKVLVLQKELVYEPFTSSGSFTTDDETVRSFKTGGVISQLYVGEGDAVHAGQLLATLDLTEIKTQVSQAELAFQKAERDFRRAENLYRDSVATLEQLQNATTGLNAAKEQLTQAQFNRTYSEIRATEEGFILRKFVNEGQVVGPGTPVFMTNGAGNGNWKLRVSVSDGQWSSIKAGDSAEIRTDLPEMKAIRAIVFKKAGGVDPVTGTFAVDLKPIPDVSKTVASGMFGKATITPSSGRNLWRIPYDALLDGNGSHGYVFVTCDNKTAMRKQVAIAGINRDYVLIDSGLEGCDNLIVTGSAYLTDKSPISIIH